MSETTNEDRMYPIEMTLQGARCCISIGKGVIKALGKPSHVSIKISDSHDSLSVFPCDEDDVMAFRVPLKLFTDHRCVMRINSKQFVHGIMRTNQMDTSKTYVLSGEFLEEKNTAVRPLFADTGILRMAIANTNTRGPSLEKMRTSLPIMVPELLP